VGVPANSGAVYIDGKSPRHKVPTAAGEEDNFAGPRNEGQANHRALGNNPGLLASPST